ncbi:MAG TPA: hypothetical protein PKH79_11410 [Prolixibacteraceae bacterium]|nr:hypothetical protein [Prolixibacteraceae bacterium]HPS12740.1 hypothetical protein [Prolixibacteraceae bacterium]
MNRISAKIGFWSALAMLVTFMIWIVSFVGISATSPLFFWTDLDHYLEYYRSNNQFFQNLAKSAMFIFGPIYLLLINSFHDLNSTSERRTLSRLGLLFGLAFAMLSCAHYFVQLSSVRINLNRAVTSGMEYFLQANPLSVMTSIDMLGWTFFFGLSTFFIALSLEVKSRQGKWIRTGFLLNATSCFLAMVGYLFQIDLLTFIGVNLVVGGAMIIVSYASAKFFHQLR